MNKNATIEYLKRLKKNYGEIVREESISPELKKYFIGVVKGIEYALQAKESEKIIYKFYSFIDFFIVCGIILSRVVRSLNIKVTDPIEFIMEVEL